MNGHQWQSEWNPNKRMKKCAHKHMHTQLPKASEKWWLNHEDTKWVGPNSQGNWKKPKIESKKLPSSYPKPQRCKSKQSMKINLNAGAHHITKLTWKKNTSISRRQCMHILFHSRANWSTQCPMCVCLYITIWNRSVVRCRHYVSGKIVRILVSKKTLT